MKLERTFIENEDDGRFNWDFNAQTQVLVVNQNETNKYGEYRGYRSQFPNMSSETIRALSPRRTGSIAINEEHVH
jgi:hypothetical protein